MILTEERQSYLGYLIIDGLWKEELVDYNNDELAMRVGKKCVVQFVNEAEQIDVKVCRAIESLKRNVPEGSPEWDVLYQKYLKEEMNRRGLLD